MAQTKREKPRLTAREHGVMMNMCGAEIKRRMLNPGAKMDADEHKAYMDRLTLLSMEVACLVPDPATDREMHERAAAEGYRRDSLLRRMWSRIRPVPLRRRFRRAYESLHRWVWRPAAAWTRFKLWWRTPWFRTHRRYVPSLLARVGGA